MCVYCQVKASLCHNFIVKYSAKVIKAQLVLYIRICIIIQVCINYIIKKLAITCILQLCTAMFNVREYSHNRQ